jgi:hypothetical protein
MNLLILICVSIAVVSCLLYLFTFGISHLIDYEPGSDGINFVLFTILKIFVLKYEKIEICKTSKLFDFSWFDRRTSTIFRTLTIGGWPRLTRVMLKLKRGPFTYIFLFPRDPAEFANRVQEHLAEIERSR